MNIKMMTHHLKEMTLQRSKINLSKCQKKERACFLHLIRTIRITGITHLNLICTC